MPYVVQRHATFLVPSGSKRDAEAHHLHVVSTPPCVNNQVLLLTVSTIREGVWHDPTRILPAGCHPFIGSESFINYRFSIIKRCDVITNMVDGWVYHTKADFPANLTDGILAGARESEMTPRYVLDYLDDSGF
jgi:hypothetical protein